MSESTSGWPVLHFCKANPVGERENDVPALLRSVADSIEKRGPVHVSDICFNNGVEDRINMTVYFWRRQNPDVVYYARPGFHRLHSVPDEQIGA
jgi:hypothetical protein